MRQPQKTAVRIKQNRTLVTETITLKNIKDTRAVANSIAESVGPGSVVALIGPLGVGKTALSQEIAKALGVTEHLTSPTFTIVCEYESGRLPIYHFDVYRVHDEDELFEIGFDEYIHGRGVCLIEWADLIEDLLPEDTMYIRLEYGQDEEERICVVSGCCDLVDNELMRSITECSVQEEAE